MDLFIFTTILSLIFILLSYFGILRYFKLHCDSCQKHTENYKNLDKANDNRVVLSLSTTPDRIKKMKPTINSLLDQTVRVDQIALNIPKTFKGQEYNVPEEYKDIMNIFICNEYENCTNYIPTVLREDDNNTIILILDDNIIYGKDFIEKMIEEHKKDTKSAIVHNNSILIIPEFLDVDKFNERSKLDNTWLKNTIKANKKNITYRENFKSFL